MCLMEGGSLVVISPFKSGTQLPYLLGVVNVLLISTGTLYKLYIHILERGAPIE